ncbi:uncharacterized protein EV154DRAFT_483755 [Mucor mucedo]|uniref:uncharacterized protein n=1 Tax=Mucor mucedo TaxID=29922 RepID=UPI00221F2323|nr:uncharacterized protein EV154DRAFT_483755 [Mucor mucedo]KAI7888804.1 hypothetical protein EV154DRAFT_483755 [Mucor mucedo]
MNEREIYLLSLNRYTARVRVNNIIRKCIIILKGTNKCPMACVQIAQETVGRCATIDPGRRDLLFCVHENSTANNPNKFRFTKQYQDKFEKIKKYLRIHEAVKPARVAAAERLLVNYDSLNRDEFEQYLENRSNMTGIIQNHYVNFRTNHRTAHPLHRKLRLSVYFRRQQGNMNSSVSKLFMSWATGLLLIQDFMSRSGAFDSVGCFKKLVKRCTGLMNLEIVSAVQSVNVEVLKCFGWSITGALIDEEQILVYLEVITFFQSDVARTNLSCRTFDN